jgi:hypothetical protein
MLLAMLAGAVLGAVLYAVTPDSVTDWLGDGRLSDPGISVTRVTGHGAPESGPARLGGPFLVASRTQLGICVRDMTGSVSDDELQRHVVASIVMLSDAYPLWTSYRFTPATLLLGLGCPGESPLLLPGVERSDVAMEQAVVPRRDLASPFSVFIYVVSPGEVRHLFADGDITSRTYRQEVLRDSPDSHVAFVVSRGLYVTMDEFRDKAILSTGLAKAMGFRSYSTPADPAPFGAPTPRATYR